MSGRTSHSSYRFARCIDYIQMGNEVWSGPGGYKFYASQLSNCWTSGENPRDFLQMPSGCRSAAATKMFDWLDDQMWAVLEGSALAGRPLRIVGPAVTHSTVSAGFASPTGFAAQSVISTSDWCNERQAYFDVHAHYESRQEALDAIDQLMDNDQSGTAPWDVPIYRVALEWGPKVDMGSTWAENNESEFDKFVTPDCAGEPTYQNWEAFVNDWENDQFTSDPDFGLGGTHESFFLYGFTAVCYGPSLGGTDFEYDMAALHADQVCYLLILDQNKFTELEDEYVDVADGRQIANFAPHPSACSSCGN